ncbi:DUF72 domain-containing protein [Lentilactobacillus buchneri]|uniref:DUF72 domain-containing protein n=1 Tax=Lentilactobacillus buchneri TaxID=1581 RepID=UPI0002076184|nr:DUF72 domain-containing protein [Lentilactobacillus buchneri]AEB73853.1 protein of unknown function DUF72 [Lentilactobacillus buchneri NRRL B-30929]MCT2898766.1 DUF72 domain-containing protein [Lentilactobacillus buchneri]MDS1015093.1 DUF72 domain-containing protein [Lentilactobacillus buchneri]MQM60909.1 DUF72 domain-containing protein [Lentilactobacillus buchneri]MQM78019.1 DUF72 domain-containing protein [Lentilactobacillus buchneri]
MITIGLTTFSEHPSLIDGAKRKVRLTEYSGYFPVVELDTPFYAIPKVEVITNWQKQVPDNFQFILKANRVMTMHDQGSADPVDNEQRFVAFNEYKRAVAPLMDTGQLKAILFQFPPYFARKIATIQYLRRISQLMAGYPVAVEFRNSTWYGDEITDDVAGYLSELGMTLVAVDEPHTTNAGVPFEPLVTTENLALLRLHGRNVKGWTEQSADWRGKRTLYRYSEEELAAFRKVVLDLDKQAKEVCVIFNNNSGGDAADNALQLKKMLGIEFGGLSPVQMDLF